MRLRHIFREVRHGFRHNTSMIISVILVSMVSMFFAGAGLLAQKQIAQAKGHWYDKVQVSIFLCTAESTAVSSCPDGKASPAVIDAIGADLESMRPLVEKVHFETPKEAYDRYQQQFAQSPYANSVTVEGMPASYRVKVANLDDVPRIVSAFSGRPGIEAVSDMHQVLEPFFSFLNFLSIAAGLLAGLMVVSSILLVVTTIRQVAVIRRKQVEIMRLVGASLLTIYLPFILEVVLAVVAGAVLAIGGLYALVAYGGMALTGAETGLSISLIGVEAVVSVAPFIFGGAVLVAVVTSWLTSRKYVKV